jgi:iron complex transport system substrate-binding protein
MILSTLCPEYMVCVSGSPSSSQYKYLPPNQTELPTTGQLYGSRSTMNLESLINAGPQIIIDLGHRKDSVSSDMDMIQKTTGIATVYIEADLAHIAEAYRTMGELFDLRERAGEIASFIDETLAMAGKHSAMIAEEDRKSVMYTSGSSGLNTNARGSVQAQVIDVIGADNAVIVEDISNQGGGNIISMEQLYNFNPGIIIFSGGSIYGKVAAMPSWALLPAVKNGNYYEIPALPYNWMSNPPSINMILGVWWLGNLLYPGVYDYDMVGVAQDFFSLFWGYELTEEEALQMLSGSTFKSGGNGS